MRRFLSDEDGQAIVEYLLMLMVAISIVAILASGVRRIVLGLWQVMACEISAACPHCPPPEEVVGKIASNCKQGGG